MASSTTTLDLISESQAAKEVTANAFFDAASPATLYGRRAEACSGLAWGYYGGIVVIAGVPTLIANGTLGMTALGANYIEADPVTGAVSTNTSGFTAGAIPLYTVTAAATSVSSWVDHRAFVMQAGIASAAQAAVSATPTVGELATLANALRDALVKTGIIKGAA